MRHYASGSVRRDARQLSLPSSAPSRCRFLPVGLEVRFLLPQGVRRHFEEGQPGLPFGLRCFLGVVEATALSLRTATRRQGKIRVAGPGHSDATAARPRRSIRLVDVRLDLPRLLRASSPPDIGHRRGRAGVGAESALHDGLHLPRAPRRGDLPVQEPALAKVGDGMLPSDFFHRNVVLKLQEDAIGIRLRAPV